MPTDVNRVFSHRNSGADYVVRSLQANYTCDNFEMSYSLYDSGMYKALEYETNSNLYVVRDGRDVLVDMYNYFRMQPGTMKYFDKKTFRHFIMGYVEAYNDDSLFESEEVTKNPLDRRMFSAPVEYWLEHITSYIDSRVERMYFVNYEMMLLDPVNVLMHIGEYFSLSPRRAIIEPIEDLICYKPTVKEMGIWRFTFEEKDLQYFWGRAEDLMVKLKYSYT